jgi:hypothetical protein
LDFVSTVSFFVGDASFEVGETTADSATAKVRDIDTLDVVGKVLEFVSGLDRLEEIIHQVFSLVSESGLCDKGIDKFVGEFVDF